VANDNPSGLGAFELALRFPGQYFDKETNLNYNYFRDFDPTIGRYVQSDPIGLRGGLNTYLYVGGSPLTSVDRKGLAAQLVCLPLRACVFVVTPDPSPTTFPPNSGVGGEAQGGVPSRDRPSERPGRPETRPDRPEMRLEPPKTDNPIIFPEDVPLIPPEDCPPDCREKQRELLWLRSNIIWDGTPSASVSVFNMSVRAHNARCGMFFYVSPIVPVH
jgi:RHS repeat-associated protein